MKKYFLIFSVLTINLWAQGFPLDYRIGTESLSKSIDPTPVSNTVERILVNGNTVWIGTSKGLSKTTDDGNTWTNYFGTDDFKSEHISAVGYNNNAIWAATWHYDEINGSSIPVGTGLRYSVDEGETWVKVDQPLDQPGDSSIVYGINVLRALPVTVPQQNFIYDIGFTGNTIWVATFAGGLRKSSDFGKTWQRVVLPPDNLDSIKPSDTLKFSLQPSAGKFGSESYLNHRVFSIFVENENTIWVGTAGGINKSIDGGISWEKFNHSNQTNPITGNFILTIEKNIYDNSIWAGTWKAEGADENWGISRTDDGGKSWKSFLPGERTLDFAFKYYGNSNFYTSSDIIAATKSGAFRSSNNGDTWIAAPIIVDPYSKVSIESKDFLSAEASKEGNQTKIWLGTDNGLARITETDGFWDGTWKVFLSTGQAIVKGESFAFPNPFIPESEVTKIKYVVGQTSDVTIRIFDFGMNLVRTVLQNAQRNKNEEQIDVWDGRDENGSIVPNGVYFYRIDIGTDEPIFGKIMVLM